MLTEMHILWLITVCAPPPSSRSWKVADMRFYPLPSWIRTGYKRKCVEKLVVNWMKILYLVLDVGTERTRPCRSFYSLTKKNTETASVNHLVSLGYQGPRPGLADPTQHSSMDLYPSRPEKSGPNFYLNSSDGFLRYAKGYTQYLLCNIAGLPTSTEAWYTWGEDFNRQHYSN